MSSHHQESLPQIRSFMVERNAYIIDLTKRTIIKKGNQQVKLKLPSLSQRQSIITIRDPPKIKQKRDSLTEKIRKILDYQSPQFSLKRMLEKKVKTVTFL
ncbi:unnamed protein product (macronuclear) [Paramecium tetraurelia]|uniref:Uncharacterized protein n=1 Tax=Paramecium tetraurelia TaxID=5888 RepID=A0C5R2_PARTE|nr:uncharacterized protein GSPATT00035258001 [Paramecium tetraurelia]CAK66129.1 unnamed protein product [Paramecium tetraurelia]|eukprot:XP_001433526.1 hypothetical protein (macronuclear) [Paramecium tetraurelia strain d4-2]